MSLDITAQNVMLPNILTGVALGFIFVPLTTTAVASLKHEQLAYATGMYNLMRNIGGAAGIALMTTLLARGGQVHQTIMVAHMTPYSETYQHQIQMIQSGLSSSIGQDAARSMAPALMYGQLLKQANLWAFIDDFRLLAIMAILCLPGILLLRKPHYHGKAPPVIAE